MLQPFAPAPITAWSSHGIEPSVPVRRLEDAVWLGVLGGLLALAAVWLGLHRPPILAFARWIATAPSSLLIAWLPVLTLAALFGSLGLAPHDRLRHISGPRLWEGKRAVQRALAWARSLGGRKGHTTLAPGLPLPSRTWNRHLLLHGSVGSGKTQILAHVVRQIAATRTRALLADSKGDWTALLPDATLICPWDRRSVVWDIAQDCRTGPDAASLAQALIPSGDPKNRFWIEASRALAEAALRYLIVEGHGGWGWADLRDLLRLDAKGMRERLGPHHPAVVQVLAGSETTVGTVLASLAADTGLVDTLATAWPSRTGEGVTLWSVRRWLTAGTLLPRRVVVQAHPSDPSASQAILGLLVTLCARRMLAPSTPETQSTGLWIILDELVAAGKLDDLPALIERGRSKGVAVIVGLQDLEQIAAVYGPETASSLSSMVGTQIVCQVGPGPSRDRIADLIGRRRISTPTHTQQGMGNDPGKASHGIHSETRHLILASQLQTCLGPHRAGKRAGVRALLLPSGADVFALDWPIRALERLRPAHVPAAWTTAAPAAVAPPATPPPPPRTDHPGVRPAPGAAPVSVLPLADALARQHTVLALRSSWAHRRILLLLDLPDQPAAWLDLAWSHALVRPDPDGSLAIRFRAESADRAVVSNPREWVAVEVRDGADAVLLRVEFQRVAVGRPALRVVR